MWRDHVADADRSVFETKDELNIPEGWHTATEAHPFFSESGAVGPLDDSILLGVILDGGGMNAYASGDLHGAGVLHGQALWLAQQNIDSLPEDHKTAVSSLATQKYISLMLRRSPSGLDLKHTLCRSSMGFGMLSY